MQKVAASHWLLWEGVRVCRCVCTCVSVCISAVITPAGHWKRSAAFYLAEVFKLSADFTKNLHGNISFPPSLSLPPFLLSATTQHAVYVCVYADYFLVYLVTKSRFLFKLKSSLTPALNIIIKRGKKPSQLASYLHTPTAEIHTHTHTVTCSRHQSPLKFNPQIWATLTRPVPARGSSSSRRRSRSSDSDSDFDFDSDFDAAFWQRQSTHTSNAALTHTHTCTHSLRASPSHVAIKM